jgi:ubiquinone/menaquinone biosynthesis C-methylase UbiE
VGARRGCRDGGPTRNAGFDDRPDQYDALRSAGHMAVRRASFFAAAVAAAPGTVVEIGSGTGTLLRGLAAGFPERSFVGVEPLPGYVDFAREEARAAGLANVRFEVGTAESLGAVVGTGGAGLLISVDTLHHVADVAATAREAARAVAPGGRWQAMEPNRVHPYVWLYHVLTPGERTFPVRRFVRAAGRAGWRLAGQRTLFAVPSGVGTLPGWAQRLEVRAERVRPLAGAVVLDLVRGAVAV